MSDIKPLKILVSAHAFSPVKGSEFAVGWDYVRAIAARHKVWVITRSIEQEETEGYLLQHPDALPNVTIHYVPLKDRTFHFPLKEVVYSLIYKDWQRRVYRLARALDTEIDFDLVHHLNGIGFREPGYLWKLGKPFVWGPVGGLQYFPLNLVKAVPVRNRLFFALKNLSTAWAMHISPRPRRAATSAGAVLASSSNVAEKVQSLWGRSATVLSEVSAPELVSKPPVRRGPGEPLRIIWGGTCEPRKALNIVLLALGQLKQSPFDWRLTAVGDGPLREDWRALAHRLGIGERCNFTGRVSRDEALSIMGSGHCFVQPSLYDATSTVVAEALAHGLPVICLDHFGFRDAVNAECGIKIPPNTLDQVIGGFAKAIETIGLDEDRRYGMGIAAQKAALFLTTKHKENVIHDLYTRTVQSRGVTRS